MKKKYVSPSLRARKMDASPILSVSFEINHGGDIDNTDDVKANPIF